jgi:hypothetical protein
MGADLCHALIVQPVGGVQHANLPPRGILRISGSLISFSISSSNDQSLDFNALAEWTMACWSRKRGMEVVRSPFDKARFSF